MTTAGLAIVDSPRQAPIRVVTAASLFDGHDAAINIMRRIMQSTGAEVIHLGHNRSVKEIVDCAVQEEVFDLLSEALDVLQNLNAGTQ